MWIVDVSQTVPDVLLRLVVLTSSSQLLGTFLSPKLGQMRGPKCPAMTRSPWVKPKPGVGQVSPTRATHFGAPPILRTAHFGGTRLGKDYYSLTPWRIGGGGNGETPGAFKYRLVPRRDVFWGSDVRWMVAKSVSRTTSETLVADDSTVNTNSSNGFNHGFHLVRFVDLATSHRAWVSPGGCALQVTLALARGCFCFLLSLDLSLLYFRTCLHGYSVRKASNLAGLVQTSSSS